MPDTVKYRINKGSYTEVKNINKDKESEFVQAAKQHGINIQKINDAPVTTKIAQPIAQPTTQKPVTVNTATPPVAPATKPDMSGPFHKKSGLSLTNAVRNNNNKQFSVSGAIEQSRQKNAQPSNNTKINPTIESNAKRRAAGQQAPLPIDTRDKAIQDREKQDIATFQAKQDREKQIGVRMIPFAFRGYFFLSHLMWS